MNYQPFSSHRKPWLWALLWLLSLNSCTSPEAVSPVTPEPSVKELVGIDVLNRAAVVNAYQQEFTSPLPVMGWSGNLINCQEGTVAKPFLEAQLSRINYFRAMAGIDGRIVFVDSLNRKSQKAALMMAAANTLNHAPPATWKCYSQEGAQAAGRANLALSYGGNTGTADFITQFMEDAGSSNTAVGHRRWLLAPRTTTMGTGNIYNSQSSGAFNALWVIGETYFQSPRQKTRSAYVCWPNEGYVPYQLVFSRWSFQYDGADFSQADVNVKRNGLPMNVKVVSKTENGYGENAVVWEMTPVEKPTTDVPYDVTVQNIKVGNQVRSFTYSVIVINPK